jgi:hypothetical protein
MESYAKRTHQLTSDFYQWVSSFFRKYLNIVKKEHPILQDQDKFPLSAPTQIRILLYRGDLHVSGMDITKRRPEELPRISSTNANRILLRIPMERQIRVEFNLPLFLQAIRWARIYITPWSSLPSGRASKEKLTIGGKSVKNLSTTPCFMIFNYSVWAKGVLNFPGKHCGNCFDLATPAGMALFLHEIFHIYQFLRNPIKMLWSYVRSLRDSLVFAKILFSHRHIPFEIEAIAFEDEVQRILETPPWLNQLKQFAQWR